MKKGKAEGKIKKRKGKQKESKGKERRGNERKSPFKSVFDRLVHFCWANKFGLHLNLSL